jgi:hypothetical protein
MLNKDGAADELGKEIRRAVAKVYNWHKFLPDEILPISLPEAALKSYEGRYKRGADEVITIRREKITWWRLLIMAILFMFFR